MTIQKRSAIMGIIIVSLSILYGAAKFHSYILVEYVVEQTLIQKAPDGIDPVKIHEYLRALLDRAPDRSSRIDRLFRISEDLEKVQALSPRDLAELMEVDEP